jgi:hypothetical protein
MNTWRLTASIPHYLLCFLIGAVTAMYDFEMHIRGADWISRNRPTMQLTQKRESFSLELSRATGGNGRGACRAAWHRLSSHWRSSA